VHIYVNMCAGFCTSTRINIYILFNSFVFKCKNVFKNVGHFLHLFLEFKFFIFVKIYIFKLTINLLTSKKFAVENLLFSSKSSFIHVDPHPSLQQLYFFFTECECVWGSTPRRTSKGEG